MSDLQSWLQSLGLPEYAGIFAEQAIDWDVLPQLTERDLADLGLPMGHRKKLMRAIAQLVAAGPPGLPGGVVDPKAYPGPERRHVTVMFCDLVGSTALARQLDPEDLRSIIRAYQDCCSGIVTRFDGLIIRHIGDGNLTYFGYPRAHEDDAERALRASLDIVQAVSHLTTGGGAALQTRIGITTGLVVVGDLVGLGPAQEITAVGDPLNIASRLQSLASPNGIVVDRTTRSLASGLFTFDSLGEQVIKGVDEPIPVWSLTGLTQPSSRFAATRGARIVPFVGRDPELATLQAGWESACTGRGRLVLLTGEPGIGKSRLVEVFGNQLAGQAHSEILLQSSPYHPSTALYPLIEYVRRSAGLAAEDTAEAKLDKIADYFVGTVEAGEARRLFASLLSIPEADAGADFLHAPETRDSAFKVFLEHFVKLAAELPLLLIVEDAQWLDPTSLELLDALVDRTRDSRTMILITYRPDFAMPLLAHQSATMLHVDRLGQQECQAMVEYLAKRKRVPPELVSEIVLRADGVALFVEELTKAVLESDSLVDRGDRYEVLSSAPAPTIPATLNGSLVARLDRDAGTREVAQVGSVIGREFSFDMLAAVAERPHALLRDTLQRLVDAELLLRAGASPRGTYRFKHALVQDAAYESLLLSRRRELHGRVAAVIMEMSPDKVATEPALLAHHFKHARMPEKAVEFYLRTGRLALARTTMAEAIAAVRMGLDLLPELPQGDDTRRKEIELLVVLGHALRAARAPGAVETGETWDRARQLCTDDATYLQQILYGQFLFHQGNAHLARAREIGEELLALTAGHPDSSAFIRGHSAVGRTAFGQGDFAAARRSLGAALATSPQPRQADPLDGPESRVLNLCYFAWTLFVQGDCNEALERSAEAIAVAEGLAQPYDMVVARGNACYTHQFRRDLAAVKRHSDVVVTIAGERGFPAWQSLGHIFRGWVLVQAGDPATGVPLIERALAEHRATGERLEVPYFLGLLAECYAATERIDAGIDALDEAIEMSDETGERWYEPELRRLKGEILIQAGEDRAIGAEEFRRAADLARSQGARLWELRAALSLARARLGGEQAGDAGEMLRPILAGLHARADMPELIEAERILAA